MIQIQYRAFILLFCVYFIDTASLKMASSAIASGRLCQKSIQGDSAPVTPSVVFGRSKRLRYLEELLRKPEWKSNISLDLADFDPKELGLNSVESREVKDLRVLPSDQFGRLESTLRPYPGSASDYTSKVGFIGKNEDLLQLLNRDFEKIKKLGVSQRDLAEPLLRVRALLSKYNHSSNERVFEGMYGYLDFSYKGRRFRAMRLHTKGTQYSPFGDRAQDASLFVIVNLDNQKSLVGAFLVADLIERYGFFEGVRTEYRVDPDWIVEVFDFLKESNHK